MMTPQLFTLSYLQRAGVVENMLRYSQFFDTKLMLSFVEDYIASQALISNLHILDEMIHLESFYLETGAFIYARLSPKVSKYFLKSLIVFIILFSFYQLIKLYHERSFSSSHLQKRVRNPFLYTMH